MEFAEAKRILASLEREGVRYVLIGSMAMAAQGLIQRRSTAPPSERVQLRPAITGPASPLALDGKLERAHDAIMGPPLGTPGLASHRGRKPYWIPPHRAEGLMIGLPMCQPELESSILHAGLRYENAGAESILRDHHTDVLRGQGQTQVAPLSRLLPGAFRGVQHLPDRYPGGLIPREAASTCGSLGRDSSGGARHRLESAPARRASVSDQTAAVRIPRCSTLR